MRIFYTDGSYGANKMKAGGWAFIEISNEKIIVEKYQACFDENINNNQLELIAAIEAVKTLNKGEQAIVHCDSQYIVRGMSEWIELWQKKNWMTYKKVPVKYSELWKELIELSKEKEISWIWVRGHANDKYNYRVDELAKKCYYKPESISPEMKERKQINMKPNVGTLLYFDDTSKKYVVMLNDIKVNNELGFFARLLANSFGHELDFFSYSQKFNVVEKQTEKERKLIFKTMEQFKNNVSQQFYDLSKKCEHVIGKSHDSANCKICDQHFGWWCPESKDNTCHYFSENGFVTLINGEKVPVPPGHNEDCENYDCCIFCGDPEERK